MEDFVRRFDYEPRYGGVMAKFSDEEEEDEEDVIFNFSFLS